MFPFPTILNTDPSPAESPSDGLSNGVYDENIDLSAKQWSLAPESMRVSLFCVLV